MKKDNLGQRMKNNYENRHKHYLTRRTPVIVRLDGRAFHTFTKGLHKHPIDLNLMMCFLNAMEETCKQVQGCKMAYYQSDEISFLLTDYDQLDTDAWFNYNQSKIESVMASIFSVHFDRSFQKLFDLFTLKHGYDMSDQKAQSIINRIPTFDARAFNIPEDEVANYFLWRSLDCHRNMIDLTARTQFSHKDLMNKSTGEKIEMVQKRWNALPEFVQHGWFYDVANDKRMWIKEDRPTYEEIDKMVNDILHPSNGVLLDSALTVRHTPCL